MTRLKIKKTTDTSEIISSSTYKAYDSLVLARAATQATGSVRRYNFFFSTGGALSIPTDSFPPNTNIVRYTLEAEVLINASPGDSFNETDIEISSIRIVEFEGNHIRHIGNSTRVFFTNTSGYISADGLSARFNTIVLKTKYRTIFGCRSIILGITTDRCLEESIVGPEGRTLDTKSLYLYRPSSSSNWIDIHVTPASGTRTHLPGFQEQVPFKKPNIFFLGVLQLALFIYLSRAEWGWIARPNLLRFFQVLYYDRKHKVCIAHKKNDSSGV